MRVLDSLPARMSGEKYQSRSPERYRPSASMVTFNTVRLFKTRCVACGESHLPYQCQVFQRTSIRNRAICVRKHSLCRNCFIRGHQAKNCRLKQVCSRCKDRHHTMMCFRSKARRKYSTTTGSCLTNELLELILIQHFQL